MMTLLNMMMQFFKTGLFSVGGGLATLPFLYEMSDRFGWFSHNDIADMIAVSESTPGAIGINMSTYAGFTTAGVLGGILATFSLAAPSIIVILVIAKFLEKFQGNRYVANAFYGLRPASIAMISAAGLGVCKTTFLNTAAFRTSVLFSGLFNWKSMILGIALFLGQRKLKWHPVAFIAIAAAVGILGHFSAG